MNTLLRIASPKPEFDQWQAIARRVVAGGYTRDGILGGVRTRLFTNHLPLADLWSDTWFGPQDWQSLTRQAPPPEAALSLFAAVMHEHEPLCAVTPAQPMAVMINCAEPEMLLDTVSALAAIELARQSAWLVRGTCVGVGARGLIVSGPGHAAVAAEIAARAGGQVAIHDPLLVRVTLTRQVDGVQLAPRRILTERGREVAGPQLSHWLRREAYQEPRADVFCVTLDQRDEAVMARDLDLDRSPELYVFPLTRTSPRPAVPPLLSDVVMLVEGSPLAVLSIDDKTLIARLAADQPWTQVEAVQEVLRTIECHLVGASVDAGAPAGAGAPVDERLGLFIAEIVDRLKRHS